MSETYEFSAATPVKRPARKGAGRKAEANPFETAVKEIAGARDGDGNPLARQASFTLEAGESLKQRDARIRRFLTRASKDAAKERGLDEHAYSISKAIEETDTPGAYVVKFWDRGPRSSSLA
jgi:hypothetical protein